MRPGPPAQTGVDAGGADSGRTGRPPIQASIRTAMSARLTTSTARVLLAVLAALARARPRARHPGPAEPSAKERLALAASIAPSSERVTPSGESLAPQIIGGQEASIEQFPWQVFVLVVSIRRRGNDRRAGLRRIDPRRRRGADCSPLRHPRGHDDQVPGRRHRRGRRRLERQRSDGTAQSPARLTDGRRREPAHPSLLQPRADPRRRGAADAGRTAQPLRPRRPKRSRSCRRGRPRRRGRR